MNLCAVLPLPPVEGAAAVLTPLAGEPAVRGIVAALAPAVVGTVVVVAADLADAVGAALAGLRFDLVVVPGNATCAECLAAAVEPLRHNGATHVLVADHRHPLLAPALVARVVDALADGAALVVPVQPVTDTVKVVDGQGTITSTIDRGLLQGLQYPHGMTVDRLREPGLAGAVTVAGDADAMAVDLPADAALLEAIIACR